MGAPAQRKDDYVKLGSGALEEIAGVEQFPKFLMRVLPLRAGLKVLAMNIQHHVRASLDQVLVTSFQRRAPEIGCRKIPLLQHGSHGPIQHQDALR